MSQSKGGAYICDRVELNVYHLVGQCHQAEKHDIHADGQYSKTCVVSNQWLVLAETVLLDQASVDNMDKVPVEACINETDEDLGDTIPVFVDFDISLTWRLSHVSRNPLRDC